MLLSLCDLKKKRQNGQSACSDRKEGGISLKGGKAGRIQRGREGGRQLNIPFRRKLHKQIRTTLIHLPFLVRGKGKKGLYC